MHSGKQVSQPILVTYKTPYTTKLHSSIIIHLESCLRAAEEFKSSIHSFSSVLLMLFKLLDVRHIFHHKAIHLLSDSACLLLDAERAGGDEQ